MKKIIQFIFLVLTISILSIVAILFMPAYYFSPSSTAVDRMALYIIPLQLMVLGRFPAWMARSKSEFNTLSISVVGYSALVLFVWLNFAVHSAEGWIPFDLFPVEELTGVSY